MAILVIVAVVRDAILMLVVCRVRVVGFVAFSDVWGRARALAEEGRSGWPPLGPTSGAQQHSARWTPLGQGSYRLPFSLTDLIDHGVSHTWFDSLQICYSTDRGSRLLSLPHLTIISPRPLSSQAELNSIATSIQTPPPTTTSPDSLAASIDSSSTATPPNAPPAAAPAPSGTTNLDHEIASVMKGFGSFWGKVKKQVSRDTTL